jgi:hypothetical protein
MLAVGICTLELHIPDSNSLKGKRHVIKSIKDRLRGAFNVSVAEVEEQDLWQKAVLGVACVGSDGPYVNGVLDRVVNFVRENPNVEMVAYHIDML